MLTISYTQERHPHPQKLGLQPQHLGLGIVTLTGCHSNTPKLDPQPVAKSLYSSSVLEARVDYTQERHPQPASGLGIDDFNRLPQ